MKIYSFIKCFVTFFYRLLITKEESFIHAKLSSRDKTGFTLCIMYYIIIGIIVGMLLCSLNIGGF